MTIIEKLEAYKMWDDGLDTYAYLDADDAAKLLALFEAANRVRGCWRHSLEQASEIVGGPKAMVPAGPILLMESALRALEEATK